MKHYNFPIIIEQDNEGFFASCPDLQGCYSQVATHEEALANIRDAIQRHLRDRRAARERISDKRSLSISMIEVAV